MAGGEDGDEYTIVYLLSERLLRPATALALVEERLRLLARRD
ncbi:hypothetical protein [Spirillospora albida]|nr:hypothetical protein [Spirillospora albida]